MSRCPRGHPHCPALARRTARSTLPWCVGASPRTPVSNAETWLAVQRAGWHEVPIDVCDDLTDEDADAILALTGSTKFRCARLTGERQGVRVPRNEGVTNHVSPRAVRRSSRGVRRSVGSGSCGRAVEHRKGTCPGCRGFRIGRRQHRWPRYGERSASPAVSENPCTHESLSSGPGRPPPHLGLSAGVAKGRQNCRSRRRTGRRSQTRS